MSKVMSTRAVVAKLVVDCACLLRQVSLGDIYQNYTMGDISKAVAYTPQLTKKIYKKNFMLA
jgi:hypothetical protein